ncbi:MAG: PTS IIA-like nitrogen regulatory protein PtsN [Halobacteria archaeon]|nr:PTS IIA-like nitrogen regulatory protein PtsN [Halobacteria archaeon]
MNISELINPEYVLCCPEVGSKKRLLEMISELLMRSAPQLSQNEIFESLINREKLGSTGLGMGVAIPHGRMAALDRPACAFIKLDIPVDFDAADERPVDLVFALLVPEDSTEEHLQILSSIAELFSKESFCASMRQCTSDECVYQLLNHQEAQQIPA